MHQIMINIAVHCAYLAAMVSAYWPEARVEDAVMHRSIMHGLVCTLAHVVFFVAMGAAVQYFVNQVSFQLDGCVQQRHLD